MQNNLLFEIKNLDCQYEKEKTVLKISNLNLPKGKLIFVLGVSGIGKSTFIETLGLMNKTIADKQETSILFNPQNYEGKELKNIWNEGDDKLSNFRNDYFSFIFQSTNLMPNLSAGENMCVSQLIQGESLDTARKKVINAMESIGLDKTLYDRKISELSGGQRQRLAFVRAFTAKFEVLFGDEPTGNLDKTTAHSLMNLLKNNLEDEKRTGIIVSHDIELALNFADLIILVTPKYTGANEIEYGEVKSKYVLSKITKNNWKDGNNEDVNARKIIENVFKRIAS